MLSIALGMILLRARGSQWGMTQTPSGPGSRFRFPWSMSMALRS